MRRTVLFNTRVQALKPTTSACDIRDPKLPSSALSRHASTTPAKTEP